MSAETRADRAVYVISVAAELAGIHPQTLRVYERKGLLDPARTSGGSRRFSERDLARLRHIQDLTASGVNLEGVRRILALETEVLRLHTELERTRDEAREAIARTHRQYRRDLVPLSQAPVPVTPSAARRSTRRVSPDAGDEAGARGGRGDDPLSGGIHAGGYQYRGGRR
jgi:MerR family transcriptional regulator/heat shock protein HspR